MMEQGEVVKGQQSILMPFSYMRENIDDFKTINKRIKIRKKCGKIEIIN